MMRAVVVGLAATGEAVASRLLDAGAVVTIVEDRPGVAADYAARAARVQAGGATVLDSVSPDDMDRLVSASDLVVPSPGVPARHATIAAATRHGVPVRSEIDLAAQHALAVGRPLIVAVTGTNGKTTVTTLATAMLEAAGVDVQSAGNIGRPLIDAVHDDIDVVVAEVSSFQLAFTQAFRPRAAALLNLGPDHLDWHRTFDAYARAKANVFAGQRDDDLLVFNADDPVVAGLAAEAPARRVPFSLADGAATGFRVVDTAAGRLLVAADDTELVALEALPRAAPHDVANVLAAAALALDFGAGADAVGAAVSSFAGLAHRMQLVGEHAGVQYVDDSKATNVHATIAAVSGLHDVVLVAGGRNKGLDLRDLRVLVPHLRAVVAIGEAASEVEHAFGGAVLLVRVGSMHEAVRSAAAHARPGDTVLLSPACASFDWYDSYAARGDDFAREVRALVEVQP